MKAARMRRPRRGPLRRRLSSCREEEAPGVPAADLASPCVWPRACSSAAPVPWVPPVGPSRTRGSSAFETNLSARVSRRLPPHRPRLVAPSDVPLCPSAGHPARRRPSALRRPQCRRRPRAAAAFQPRPPPPDRGSLSAVLTVFLSPLLFGLVRSPGVDDSVCATMLSRRAQPSPDASPQTAVLSLWPPRAPTRPVRGPASPAPAPCVPRRFRSQGMPGMPGMTSVMGMTSGPSGRPLRLLLLPGSQGSVTRCCPGCLSLVCLSPVVAPGVCHLSAVKWPLCPWAHCSPCASRRRPKTIPRRQI